MKRLGRERPEVPHHRGRFQVGMRVALLRVDEIAELERIANEKNGRVVSRHVPVALFGVKLQRKPAWIARRIRRALLAADGREAQKRRSLFACGAKKLRVRV